MSQVSPNEEGYWNNRKYQKYAKDLLSRKLYKWCAVSNMDEKIGPNMRTVRSCMAQ